MSSAPKKRPGRPRKSLFEKQLQFSISLTPMTKLALEIIARDRGESLSQAVDFAITAAASNYEVEGQRLMKNLRERMNCGLKAIGVDPDKEPIEKVIAVQNDLLRSEAGKVFMVPQSLWTPEEKYFVDVFSALKDGRLPVKELDDLLELCVAAYNSGISKDTIVQQFNKVIEDGMMFIKDPNRK